MRNSLTLLNENGDTTISWDESNDEKMITLIEKKMSEGMIFFIVRQTENLTPIKIVARPNDIRFDRTVIMKDADFNDLIVGGNVTAFKRPAGTVETQGMLHKAADAVKSHVVGIKQRVGG